MANPFLVKNKVNPFLTSSGTGKFSIGAGVQASKPLLTSSNVGTPSQASVGFEQTVNKPSINPLSIVKAVGQGIASSGGSVALTIANKPTITASDLGISPNAFRNIYGQDEVKSLATRIAEGEQTAKGLGLGKASLPASFGLIGGLTALDFTPFGGEKTAVKALVKETSIEGVSKILRSMGVAEDIVKTYAPKFAKTQDAKIVQQGLDALKTLGERTKMASQTIKTAPGEAIVPKVDSATLLKNSMGEQIDLPIDFLLKKQGNPPTKMSFDKLANEIKTSGKLAPLSITPDGFMVDGWHRLNALKQLGVDTVPVYVGKQLGSTGRLETNYPGLQRNLTDFYNQTTKGLDTLTQEARKYKSVEEFVKAQGGIPKEMESLASEAKKYTNAVDFRKAVNQSHLMDLSNPEVHNWGRAFASYADEPLTDISQIVKDADRAGSYLSTMKYSNPVEYKAITAPGDTIIIYRAVPKNVGDTIRIGDYVALDKKYAQMHLDSVLQGEQKTAGKIISMKVPKKDIVWGDADFTEWAYSPQKLRQQFPTLEDFYNKVQTKSQLTDIYNQATKEGITQKLPQVLEQGVSDSKSLQDVATKIEKTPILQGEQSTLKISEEARLSSKVDEADSLVTIIHKNPNPLKAKINAIDYLRTPDRVLKKIGLEAESDLIRKKYNDYITELPKQIEKITEWSKEVPKESSKRIFQFLDGKGMNLTEQEHKVATEVKDYLVGWADRLNLPKDNRISSYITHIFEEGFIQKEFDEDLAKIIADKVPGSVYDPFLEKRLGKLGYVEDVWRALDAYTKRAVRKVHMDVALEKLSKSADYLEQSQLKYVKNYADRINLRPTWIDDMIDNTIKQMVGYKFGQRPVTTLTRKARMMVYRGTLGLNIGSAVRNLTQGINTYAKLGERYTVTGYLKLFSNFKNPELDTLLKQNIIQDRTLASGKQVLQKIDKGLWSFFETAERINRGAAYFGAKAKALNQGLSEEKAVAYAQKIVRDTQFTFGSIDTPLVLQQDIVKTLGQFQSFSLKQAEFLGEMVQNKEIAGMIRYATAGTAVFYTVGKLFGFNVQDLIPFTRFGAPPLIDSPKKLFDAATGAKDQYGNEPTPKARLQKARDAVLPFIPAGVQAKKSIQAIQAILKGASYSASGKTKQYKIEEGMLNKIRAILFGKSNLPEAQNYFNKPSSTKSTNPFLK